MVVDLLIIFLQVYNPIFFAQTVPNTSIKDLNIFDFNILIVIFMTAQDIVSQISIKTKKYIVCLSVSRFVQLS